jgi:hypothetical protein
VLPAFLRLRHPCLLPQRSNLFQKVVRVLHQTIAVEAIVDESGFLIDSDTGSEREVDVVIKTTSAGHELILAVEATAAGRRADVIWVESMLMKHAKLPSNKLVLVSEAGFSEDARTKAEENGATTIAPDDLPVDFDGGDIINKLGAIYVKMISLDILDVEVDGEDPEAGQTQTLEPPPLVEIFLEDGSSYGSFADLVRAHFHERFLEIAEQVDLANVTETVEKDVRLKLTDPSVTRQNEDKPQRVCLNPMSDGKSLGPWPIRSACLKARMRIEVGEIPLTHKRLGPVSDGYSYGEGQVGESKATFVVSKTAKGAKGRMIVEGADGPQEGELNLVDQRADYGPQQ